MKLLAMTVAATLVAGAATAQELTYGGEVNAEYNLDAENMTITLSPEVGYTFGQVDFTLGSDIAVYNDEIVLGDEKPTLDFGASYYATPSLELYGKVSYSLETESRGDVVVGATFSF